MILFNETQLKILREIWLKGKRRRRFIMKKAGLILAVVIVFVSSVFSQVLPNIPRSETLIVDNLHGRVANPGNFNVWIPGALTGHGPQQMVLDGLWYVDPQTGEWINSLAAEPPIYNDDFTKMTVKLRQGALLE